MKPKPHPIAHSPAVQRVNVDFPLPMLQSIDAAAERIGVNRQAWIKMQLAAVLQQGEK